MSISLWLIRLLGKHTQCLPPLEESHRLPCGDREALHTLLDLALDHWANGILSGSAAIFPRWRMAGTQEDDHA